MREGDRNSQRSWNLRKGAGAARGPTDPTNWSPDVVRRPTYSSFQRGGHCRLWTQRRPVGAMPAWPAPHRAARVTGPCCSLLPLLGASHGEQSATSYHCAGTCIITLLSAYHHELAITLLLEGRAAAGDNAGQLRVDVSEPLHFTLQFWIAPFGECIPIVQKILWSHRKAVFFLNLEGLTHGWAGRGRKRWKKDGWKGPSSPRRTPGLHKGDRALGLSPTRGASAALHQRLAVEATSTTLSGLFLWDPLFTETLQIMPLWIYLHPLFSSLWRIRREPGEFRSGDPALWKLGEWWRMSMVTGRGFPRVLKEGSFCRPQKEESPIFKAGREFFSDLGGKLECRHSKW